MTRQRALRLAREWSQGHVCSLRDGEAAEYHSMFAAMLEESMPNEPLTLEQLREMNGEPVYLVAQRYGISEWNILNGMDEIVLAYDEPVVGMKAVIPGIKFINRRVLGVGSYGEDWFAYRRPPEGEA